MKIGCIGSGYVGSTTMSVLAYKNLKHDVFITDILKDKVEC
jgi:UDP-glucose 6-dehydrogenase